MEFNHVDGPSEMLSGIVKNYDERHNQRIEKEINELGGKLEKISVQSYNLNNYLNEKQIKEIDLLSIDVEGSEFEILKTINFNELKVNAIAIENNYKLSEFKDLLTKFGFYSVGYLCSDEIFVIDKQNLFLKRTFLKFFSLFVRIKKKLKS